MQRIKEVYESVCFLLNIDVGKLTRVNSGTSMDLSQVAQSVTPGFSMVKASGLVGREKRISIICNQLQFSTQSMKVHRKVAHELKLCTCNYRIVQGIFS